MFSPKLKKGKTGKREGRKGGRKGEREKKNKYVR